MSERDVQDIYPLLPLQEGLLFHAVRDHGDDYVSQIAFTLRGRLDEQRWLAAWRAVAARHEALRTAYVWEGVERPLAVVLRTVELEITRRRAHGAAAVVALENPEKPDDIESLEALIASERTRPFDLGQPPHFRLLLVQLAPTTTRIVWTAHHLALDGWSLGLVLDEVFAHYAAGPDIQADPAPRFRDIVAWNEGRDAEASRAYWQATLAGLRRPTPLALAPASTPRWSELVHTLDAEATQRIAALARAHGVTPNTCVLAAWARALAILAGEDEILLGITLAGRPPELPAAEHTVGHFVNTVALRLPAGRGRKLGAFLRDVHARLVDVERHQWTSLADVRAASAFPERAPLFECAYVFENYPLSSDVARSEQTGLQVDDVQVAERTHYPVSLAVFPGERLSFKLIHDAARFAPERAEATLARVVALLAEEGGEDRRLTGSALSADEFEAFARYGDGGAPVSTADVLDVIDAQALTAPAHLALDDGRHGVSYGELVARTSRLARVLRRRGVGPETRVVLALPRGNDGWIAALSVLRAGGAWVPLDPRQPAARLRALVRDLAETHGAPDEVHDDASSCPGADERTLLVIVAADAARTQTFGEGTTVLTGSTLEAEARDEDATPPDWPVHPEQAAYVVFTSGSTGTPKGVVVARRGLVNMARGHGDVQGVEARTRFAQLAPTSFDASIHEAFTALCCGATLCPIDPDVVAGPELTATLARLGITAASMPPSVLRELDARRLPALHGLLVGGELLAPELYERWSPGRRFANVYGPTEATVIATRAVGDCARDTIGRPIPGVRVHLLDGDLEPVPPGAPGEVFLGGQGVARGYAGRPRETAERFVPDPFARAAGARLVRTGDRARWRADGTLVFLGRVDLQIKVRGVRIEPGEVEATLAAHPDVEKAVVGVRRVADAEVLVAWLLASVGARPAASTLRAWLFARLPAAQVPDRFVVLERLPRTRHGKVDRDALDLPAPLASSALAPERALTSAEEELAGHYEAVLGLRPTRPSDDFFALGGHSLRALRLLARLRSAYDAELELGTLFETSRLDALALRLANGNPSAADAARQPAAEARVEEPTGPAPATLAQTRLWFLERLDESYSSYLLPAALELVGPLDEGALDDALARLVARHASLRTRFVEGDDGEPRQIVEPAATFGLERREATGAEASDEVARVFAELAARPFDLTRAPLLRATLLRTGADRSVLVLVVHHLVADGLSVAILARELAAFYRAARAGTELTLTPVPLDMRTIARRERARDPHAGLEFWRRELAGAPLVLELPTDHPRPPQRDARGATERLTLEPGLRAGVEALAREEGTTPFVILLTAYQTFLARVTGQTDFLVGTPVSDRVQADEEELVGLRINTVVLRTPAARGERISFRSRLADVHARVVAALAQRSTPFETLAVALVTRRDPTRTPLVQTLFSFQNFELAELDLGDVRARLLPLDAPSAKFDLSLSVQEAHLGQADAHGWIAAFEYATALFEPTTVQRLLAGLRTLLAAAVARPDAPCSELSSLDTHALQTLAGFETGPPVETATSLGAAFEASARRRPTASALTDGSHTLDYATLERRSAAVARALLARGLRAEERVALELPRSLDYVVAVLGVVRAGGVFVPLDPELPPTRRSALSASAHTKFVVVRTSDTVLRAPGQGASPAQAGADVRATQRPGAVTLAALERQGQAADVALPEVGPDRLAYVLFTSGSTGTPKGVAVTHRAVVRLARSERYAPFGELESVAFTAPVGFDPSIAQIFGPLLAGARSAVLEVDGGATPTLAELGRFLRATRPAFLRVPPALLAPLLEREATALADVAWLALGGEAASAAVVTRALARLPDTRLVNGYGPTECTTIATAARLTPPLCESVTIGRPIEGTIARVLDARLARVPVGVWGELCLGGAGLARGYDGDPRTTAERFVPDAFAAELGSRLYRTGDRARWHADGTLEFGGRLDRQVQVNGYRVEPREIEAALERAAGIARARVGLAGQRLVAWVVLADGAELDAAGLRAQLASELASHQVPSAIVTLEQLPLGPNQKVDDAALPAPGDAPRGATPPATETEVMLAGLWSELLGGAPFAREDDFFELGGHSLLAVRLAARLREACGVELPLRTFFEAPRLAELARAIDTHKSTAQTARALERRVPSALEPVSFAQERLWLAERLADAEAAPPHGVQSFRWKGVLDLAALEAAFRDVIARHEPLRTSFVETPDGLRARTHAHFAFTLVRADLSHLSGTARATELAARTRELARRPFETTGTVAAAFQAREGGQECEARVRAACFTLAPDEVRLVLVTHHAACDGWSLGVLARELDQAYAARRADRAPVFEPLAIRYADFVHDERERFEGGRHDAEREFWGTFLTGATEPLGLGRRAGPSAGARATHLVDVELSASTTRVWRDACTERGATPFIGALAALQATLGRLADQERFVLGSPGAGRTRPETHALVGMFVDLLPLPASLAGDPTFDELFERARATALAASEHDAPHPADASALLDPEGLRPRRGELFEVVFTMHAAPFEELTLGGGRIERDDPDVGVSVADLWLAIEPHADGSWNVTWQADARRFERDELERIRRVFERALDALARRPSERVSALELWEPGECSAFLGQHAHGPCETPSTVTALFAAVVAAHGERVAVARGDEALTYRELDARANRLARLLADSGALPETVVALALEPSPRYVEAVLAVLRTGAAFLPIDPKAPEERVGRMLEASGAALVVTDAATVDTLPGGFFLPLVLDELEGELATRSDAPLAEVRGPDSLAYVMFTSGSTGEPKGVQVRDAAIARLVRAPNFVAPSPADRMLGFAPVAFDASTLELFLPLAHGARLEWTPRPELSPAELATFLRERGITLAWLTAELFHRLVEADVEALAGLRTIIAGGEALSPAHVARALAAFETTLLVNGYGPTENTTFTACHVFDPNQADGADTPVPLGRPLPGTYVRVVDRDLRARPPGAWGELVTGGLGLARGYLNAARETAARFVPDPDARGERLYRTGDRVRWRAEGTLEFGGRLDRQIKLRGQRIEPAEIECHLNAHPAVQRAVVDVHGADGAAVLAAWVVATDVEAPELVELLRRSLPEPLVPKAIRFLARLPLKPNGKLDRAALPDPLATESSDAPMDEDDVVLELLANEWRTLLGRERVARSDDFFELGGHSLSATQLVARVREVLGVELPLTTIFEHPRLGALAEAIQDLRLHAEALAAPPITRAPEASSYPLTFAQERLFFLQRLSPESSTYHSAFALELHGAVDAGALRTALAALIARHEVLRTALVLEDGTPRQVVHAQLEPDLRVENLASLVPERRAERVAALEREVVRTPFDLAAARSLRAVLLHVGDARHELLLCLHHVASDGWTLAVFCRELSALYAAACEGRTAALPALEVQVRDVAVWQREHQEGEPLERGLAFWSRRLAGAPTRIELDLAPNVPPGDGRAVGRLTQAFDSVARARIEAFARANGATPFLVLLAAFEVALAKLAATRDFVVHVPVANRTRAELAPLLGFFVNVLPLRASLAGAFSFRQLCERVRADTLEAFDVQDVPYERIVRALGYERSVGGRPPLQLLFAFQNAPLAALSFSGVEATARDLEASGAEAHAELGLVVEPAPDGGYRLAWEYDATRHDDVAVAAFATAFQALVGELLDGAERPLSSFALATDTGRGHEADAAPELSEHVLGAFRRHADRIAVEVGGRRVTYGELARRADRLARQLTGAGVRLEEPLALLARDTDQLVVAMAACLFVGAPYVPLDATFPTERLLASLAAVGATRGLGGSADDVELLTSLGLQVLRIDGAARDAGSDANHDTRDDDAFRPRRIPAEALCHVLFTSGSTGAPKPVGLTRRNLASFCALEHWDVGSDDRFGRAANPVFDVVAIELWPTLLAGGTVVELPREHVLDPERLARAIRARGLTHLFLTSAVLHSTAQSRPDAFAPLRSLRFGGERVRPEPVRALLEAGAPGVLWHLYGPTETTVFSSGGLVRSVPAGVRTIPFGGPFPGTFHYVLDDDLQPVPDGCAGELVIGGDGVGRGYPGRARETAARFLPDPFRSLPGARMYRTGDRVRRDAQDAVCFLGRRDGQIKLLGQRIELGGIDSALGRVDGVRMAAADVRSDPRGEPRLVAWLVTANGMPTHAALRAALARELPAAWIPQHFVSVEHLPLNAHAKVDRRWLPDPVWEAERRAARVPDDPFVAWIATLWSEVLHVERAGGDDDFFACGGHSLSAARLAARVSEALGCDVALRLVFEAPRLRDFAERVRALRGTGDLVRPAFPRPTPARTAQRRGPLSPAQERLWFLSLLQPNDPAYNVPGALRLTGNLDVDALRRALDHVTERHEALRTRIVDEGGVPEQVVGTAGLAFEHVPYPEARSDQAALARRLRELGRVAVDPRQGPGRCTLLEVSAREHVVVLVLHHLFIDGWSLAILFDELSRSYALEAGFETEAGADPTVSAALQPLEVAAWQRRWSTSPAFAQELESWRTTLAGAPEELPLPTDRPRPAVASTRGGTCELELPAETARHVGALAVRAGASPFMVLLAAFEAWLARLAGVDDFCVGVPHAGRTRPELEGSIGFFVNTLVLRSDVPGARSFDELVRRVRRRSLDAFEHADVPFEAVVNAVQPARSTGRTPLFQVMFALQNTPRRELALAGLALEPLDVPTDTAKFDLVLAMTETDAAPGAGKGLAGTFEYDATLFDAATVSGFAESFASFLDALVRAPQRDWRAAAWVSAPAQARLIRLARGPEPGAPLPPLERIAAWARQDPDALAVEEGDARLTRGALVETARTLAGALGAAGAGVETVVAVLAGRSTAEVIAAVGAKWCGAAPLLLSPEDPPERLAAIVREADALVVVAARRHALLARSLGIAVLTLDTGPNAAAVVGHDPEGGVAGTADDAATLPDELRSKRAPRNPIGSSTTATASSAACAFELAHAPTPEGPSPAAAGNRSTAPQTAQASNRSRAFAPATPVVTPPDALGYVVATSGSTGTPKIVLVPERGLANLCAWHARAYGLGPTDRSGRIASSTFDAAVWETWPALAAGASLALVPDELRLDPSGLVTWVADRGLTVLFLPTPLAELVLAVDQPEHTTLRALLAGGDRLRGRGTGRRTFRLFNHYGPSEASVVATAGDADDVAVTAGAPVPTIGRPIDGVRAYVLDERLEPVPRGVRGELVLGGATLARGYAKRPRETAVAFVPDPFDATPGARAYRTGDVVSWNPCGELVFHGRVDGQVKLRGQRIEPGEIEAALVACEGVREAVVLSSGEHLRAYLVPETNQGAGVELDPRRVRDVLRGRLPAALVPTEWLVLPSLPWSKNGKIDRTALPEPSALVDERSAPRGAMEELVAQAFREVFETEPCCATNVFDQGAHSLGLVRVRATLEQALGREVAVVTLFRFPTIRALAAHLERGESAARQTTDAAVLGAQRADRRRAARAGRRGRRGETP